MIYLDNAATSFPKASGVAAAMSRFLERDAANPGRSAHAMAVRAEQMLAETRLRIARLIGAPKPEQIIFTLNCTDALNLAIKGVVAARENRAHVVTTVLEHNSVSRPLEALVDANQITLTRVGCDADGFASPDKVASAITAETRLVVMTHASNVIGTIQDAQAVGRLCRERDILYCLDAAQTAGVVPIDVEAIGAQLVAMPGHKSLLGPTGTGVLYVSESCATSMSPWREGGTGGDSATRTQPRELPFYFEGGTPNTVGIAGLNAALIELEKTSFADRFAHETSCIERLIEKLRGDDRFTMFGPPDRSNCVPLISLNIVGYEPQDVAAILDESFGIAVRAGLHCSPYAHKAIGTFPSGTVRISPGPLTTFDEMEQCADALVQIADSAG